MRSRLLHLRLWLEKNNIFPTGRLALISCYLLALDVLFLVLQRIDGLFRWHFGKLLSGWVIFLTLIVIVLFVVLAARRLSSKLLWRMRNRLIVTYVFIGIIPVILLVSLAAQAFYLFAGQFATYIVTSRLNSELEILNARNETLARGLLAEVEGGQKSASSLAAAAPRAIAISAWLNDQMLFYSPNAQPAMSIPTRAPAKFSHLVRDKNKFSLRASITETTSKRERLTVVSSEPLDEWRLLSFAADLGAVTFFEPGVKAEAWVPKSSVGNVPVPMRALDRLITLAADIPVMNWADGQMMNGARMSVQTRLSKLYQNLFSAPGDLVPAIELMLLLLAVALGISELIAMLIGNHLTQSVSGAVEQLYRATTHINRGDFSHRIPITSNDQLAALAKSFNGMTESIERLLREQKEKQRLENEITIAQEVQAQLFPRRISQMETLDVYGFCRPARSVSGDYYDFLPLGSDRLVLAVGDVSGKGISAALLMATIHSAVRAYSLEGIPVFRQAEAVGAGPVVSMKYDPIIPGAEASPGTLLSLLNHQLYHSTPMEKYATLFLAVYDGSERRLTYSNAGHLAPLLLGRSAAIRRLEHGGTVVGLFDDMTYDEGTVQLRPGDIFLAYSDGVTEPENEFGEFGEERLIELVRENHDLPLRRICEIVTAAVDDWIGAAEQPDDVTLVLARAV